MNARLAIALALWLFGALAGQAQGFAGLGGDASGFAMPDRAYRMTFPADHGPHPDFRVEWWYLTANLTDADGREYGVHWTLFRTGLRPGEATGWSSPQIWMGHAALTTPDRHLFAEKVGRGGTGQAGVTADPFAAWIDDWQMIAPDGAAERLSPLHVAARGDGFSYALDLAATGPLVLNGQNGYSVKSPDGQASHYYSQPFYRVSGTLTLGTDDISVTGTGWLDREWSSQPLAADQRGWDWLALSFEDGARLMGFRLRGARGDFTAGTWIDAGGRATALPDGVLKLTPLEMAPVAGRQIPVRWRVRLARVGLDVEIAALNRQSWMATTVPYWEGPVRVTGSHPGRGYLEMTGYGAPRVKPAGQ